MFCTNCGSRLQNSDIFCGSCGSKVLITEDNVNTGDVNESYENPILQSDSSQDQNLKNQYSNESNTNYEKANSSVNTDTAYNYNYSSSTNANYNPNYQGGNFHNSFNTNFINETANYLKLLFINPLEFLSEIYNMNTAVTATIGLLSLLLTLFSINIFSKNLIFSYLLDSGQTIFSLFIYCLGLSSALFICSIVIINKKVSWMTLLKLSIVVSLISSIGCFLSAIFMSLSTVFAIMLLVLTSIIGILITYEGFLRITSTTIKNAKISLITSYCVVSFLSYLFIYSNM